ncbi:ion channel [Algibacillus agarilyticus]|uniref:ion channel n=1 Tax=Algibacillus agarilyticus TaxID=2234133 RepID=UPI000DD01F69|nr:potassium channel family protein [Algibacillus agarilyticus]
MSVFSLLVRKFMHHFARLSWRGMLLIVLTHYIGGYYLCILAEQPHLVTDWHTYFHFWIVTISTVGYGDFYAQGGWQKVGVDIWFIGLGLGIFGSLIGKIAEHIFYIINRHTQGMKNFNSMTDHIVLFCNNRLDAQRIVELLLADTKRQDRTILLCTTSSDMQHPMPDHDSIEFAVLNSFVAQADMQRINIQEACRVIICDDSDEENLALTVHLSGLVAKNCHIVAHFENESHIESLQRLHLKVECSTSKRVEQLVRASQDHGATALIHQLLNTQVGMTLYVIKLTDLQISFKTLKSKLYQEFGADVIGIAYDELGKTLQILPKSEPEMTGDIYVHYLNDVRLSAADFNLV